MNTAKTLSILVSLLGVSIIVFGFILKNSWQVCAGTYMTLWAYEAYQNHKLINKLTQMLPMLSQRKKD